jgi:hypothetical protein
MSALGRLRQEDHKFEANLSYKARHCLTIPKKKNLKKVYFLTIDNFKREIKLIS